MGLPVSGAQVEINAMPEEETEQHVENMENEEPSMGGMEGRDPPPAPTAVPTEAMHGMGSAPVVEEAPEGDHPDEPLPVMLELGEEPGEYEGEISFPASGHWMLTVHLSLDGETFEADFPVEVTGGSPAKSILVGFASINAVLIAVAAITRRKPVSA